MITSRTACADVRAPNVYRAAYGRTCGPVTSPAPALSAARRAGIADLPPNNSSAKVWVNTNSRVYHYSLGFVNQPPHFGSMSVAASDTNRHAGCAAL